MSRFQYQIRSLNAARVAAATLALWAGDAAALTVNSIENPTIRAARFGGACIAADRTRFHVRFSVTGDTADSGARDLYSLYLVDGAGLILHRRGQNQRNGRTNTRTRGMETQVDPTSGPFRIVIVDRTVGAPQAQGQILTRAALASVSFDANALDPDCPAPPPPPPPPAVAETDDAGAAAAALNAAQAAARGAIEQQTAEMGRTGILQPAGLTLGRLRRIAAPAGGADAGGVAAGAGLFGLSTGAAGQAAPEGWGLWGDATWSRLQPEAAGGGTTDAVAVAGGVDRPLGAHVVAGVAVFGSVAEGEGGGVETTARSVGVSPYVSVSLGEGVGLHASAGYAYAWGETEWAGGAGEYDAHRGYATLEASIQRQFGDVSVLAATGALFGRSARGAYVDSGGLAVDSDQTDIGSAHILAQPGYRIDFGDGLAATPYIHAEYRRAFATDSVADPNSGRLGFGARIESENGVSGYVEALRGVGAGGAEETSLQLHIAFDF